MLRGTYHVLKSMLICGALVLSVQCRPPRVTSPDPRLAFNCEPVDDRSATPVPLHELAGQFDLVAVATSGSRKGASVSGLLSLEYADHLWGWTTVDLLEIGVTDVNVAPSSQLRAQPGIQGSVSVIESRVVLSIGSGGGVHGGAYFLIIGRDASGVVIGTWSGDREQPRPSGYFCLQKIADRSGGSEE